MARIGTLALARPTFDVPFAEEIAATAFAALEREGHEIVGPRTLLFDAVAAEAALAALEGEVLDLLLLLQVTFTDASMTVAIGRHAGAPLALWAFPEPRTGGRLRLNSFCGLNLAAHALGRAGIAYRWLYAAPDAATLDADLAELVAGTRAVEPPLPHPPPEPEEADARAADSVLERLAGTRIGLIGEHPVGFDTCRYDPGALRAMAGIGVERIALPDLFAAARAVAPERIAQTKSEVAARLSGTDALDQPQLERSLAVYHALAGLAREKNLSALAVRCWPEMFTEFGCASCGPMAFLSQERTPCACEADVYGALTSLILQELAGAPAFLADIVDMDAASETGVLWHCGLAPASMADPATPPAAQIHSNRKMPLLQEFALAPGRITLARLSQAHNAPALVIAGAEIVAGPKSFSGTSGLVRFDKPVADVTRALIDGGLEHHVSLVYGDVRPALRALAARLSLPIVELS